MSIAFFMAFSHIGSKLSGSVDQLSSHQKSKKYAQQAFLKIYLSVPNTYMPVIRKGRIGFEQQRLHK